MDKHPISSLMSTTMENIKDMVDVNTVVGDPVQTSDGTTIIPISRVSFGFVAGGGEYNATNQSGGGLFADSPNPHGSYLAAKEDELPFAGGTGAGVSVHPMGFLVVGNGSVKMLPTNYATPVDRIMELLPQVIGELKDVIKDDDVTASVSHSVPVSDTFRPDPIHTSTAHNDTRQSPKLPSYKDAKAGSPGDKVLTEEGHGREGR